MQKALLVIDMQTGLFEGENAIEQQERLFKVVNRLIDKAHQDNQTIIFVQHTEEVGLVESSAQWQLDQRLHQKETDKRMSKKHLDAFWDTPLIAYLKDHDIHELIIVGCQTEYCIDTTIRSAKRLGYEVTLIKDGHSTVSNNVLSAVQIINHHNLTLSSFVSVILSKDFKF